MAWWTASAVVAGGVKGSKSRHRRYVTLVLNNIFQLVAAKVEQSLAFWRGQVAGGGNDAAQNVSDLRYAEGSEFVHPVV